MVEKTSGTLIKQGLMGKKELEAMFDFSFLTLNGWIKKGFLPEPVNKRPLFREILAPNAPLKWDREEVMRAFERMKCRDGKKAEEGQGY